MEGNSRSNSEEGLENGLGTSEGWEAWNAVPRDGPAVFVVDTAAFDLGEVRGRWLEVNAGPAVLQAELTTLLGREPEEGAWAIVDQIGLGELMAPEAMTLGALTTVAEDLAAESRG